MSKQKKHQPPKPEVTPSPVEQTPAGEEQNKPQEKKPFSRRPVVTYLLILFAAAFALLAMSYAMELRQNDEQVTSLNQTVSELRASVSAMKDYGDLKQENETLNAQLEAITAERDSLASQLNDQTWNTSVANKQLEAMTWLMSIQNLYENNYYTKARKLVESFEEAGLPRWLPQSSYVIGDTQHSSPAEQYKTMKTALGVE